MATINIPGEIHRVVSLVAPGPCPSCGEVGACRSTLPCPSRLPIPGSFGAWLLQLPKERFDWVFEGVTLDAQNERKGPRQRVDMLSAAFAGGLAALLAAVDPGPPPRRDNLVHDVRQRNRFEAWALAHIITDHLEEAAVAALRPLLQRWGALITPGSAAQLDQLPGARGRDLATQGPVVDKAYQELVDRAQTEPRALEVLDELRAVSAAHECPTIRAVRQQRQESGPRARGSA